MVALVDDYDVPPRCSDEGFEVLRVNRPVDAGDQARVIQPTVDLSRRGPLAETQSETVELPADVVNQPGRGQIEHTKPAVPLQPFLDQEPDLDCLAQPHLVSDEDSIEFRLGVEDMSDQADLMHECADVSCVEATLRVFDQEIMGPETA
jgi:hypothetical protein